MCAQVTLWFQIDPAAKMRPLINRDYGIRNGWYCISTTPLQKIIDIGIPKRRLPCSLSMRRKSQKGRQLEISLTCRWCFNIGEIDTCIPWLSPTISHYHFELIAHSCRSLLKHAYCASSPLFLADYLIGLLQHEANHTHNAFSYPTGYLTRPTCHPMEFTSASNWRDFSSFELLNVIHNANDFLKAYRLTIH